MNLLWIFFALAMGLLIVAGMRQPGGYAYYLTVGEFLSHPAQQHRDGFRVNGKVAQGTIERLESGEDARFVITDGSQTMSVVYHGIIPDTFSDSVEVVVEGRLDASGTFQATTLLAKCASRYEMAPEGYEAMRDAYKAGASPPHVP